MKRLMPQTLRSLIALAFVLISTVAIVISAGVVFYLLMWVEQGSGILSFFKIETSIPWLGEFIIVSLGLIGLFSLLAFLVARRLITPVDELIVIPSGFVTSE